mgnify:CR=1 FL=1
MLFLKNLLLRNFQGCCLLFNYQGSSLFLLIRSSFDILSRRFPFVKNFFHFLFAVCSGSVSPSQVSFNRLSHPHPSVKNFFHVVQRSALASCPQWPLGLFFSSVCLSDKWYLITGKVNCQCFFCFLFFSHNSDNSLFFLLTVSCCSYVVLYFAQYKTAAFKNSAHPDTSSS